MISEHVSIASAFAAWIQDLLLLFSQVYRRVLVVWIVDLCNIYMTHRDGHRFDGLSWLSCWVRNPLDFKRDFWFVLQLAHGLIGLVPIKVLSRYDVVIVFELNILERHVWIKS